MTAPMTQPADDPFAGLPGADGEPVLTAAEIIEHDRASSLGTDAGQVEAIARALTAGGFTTTDLDAMPGLVNVARVELGLPPLSDGCVRRVFVAVAEIADRQAAERGLITARATGVW